MPEATRPDAVVLLNGDTYELEIGPVRKQIAGSTVRTLASNRSILGPARTGTDFSVRTYSEVG